MSEAAMRELEALRAENAKLKAVAQAGLKLKVSPKGGIMLLGMRGFPVTFYHSEWLKILDMGPQIQAFALANKAELDANQANPKESKNKFKAIG